jgi:rare lipoprotein A (peptidoglycan hydrolase)
MKKPIALLFLSLLFLNCSKIEAKTKHQVKVAKHHVIKKLEPLAVDSTDSTSSEVKDSLNLEKHGIASWYTYCGGLFAASTRFKKGSVLRVINPANNKYVDVTVNDYGPNKRKHPNRIIDLDMFAFKKIASLDSGLIRIIVQPLKIF